MLVLVKHGGDQGGGNWRNARQIDFEGFTSSTTHELRVDFFGKAAPVSFQIFIFPPENQNGSLCQLRSYS